MDSYAKYVQIGNYKTIFIQFLYLNTIFIVLFYFMVAIMYINIVNLTNIQTLYFKNVLMHCLSIDYRV